jgi:hypothetical protein
MISATVGVMLSPVLILLSPDKSQAKPCSLAPRTTSTAIPVKTGMVPGGGPNDELSHESDERDCPAAHFNETGKLIWDQVDGEKNCYQIAEEMTVRYEVSFEEAVGDVEMFVAQMVQKGYLLIEKACPCYAY